MQDPGLIYVLGKRFARVFIQREYIQDNEVPLHPRPVFGAFLEQLG